MSDLQKSQNKPNVLIAIFRAIKKGMIVAYTTIVSVAKYISARLQTDNGRRIMHWLFFSVLLSLLPLALAISQDKMSIEYTFEQIKTKYATDFILAVFAVAVNLSGCTVHGKVRIDGLAVSITSMLYLLSKYTHLHNPKTVLLPGVQDKLLIVVVVILVLNAIFGIFLQVVSEKVKE